MLDDCLSGESIVYNVIKKASGRLFFLYRHSNILNFNDRKTLCSALIQCHFDYSCSSWYTGLTKGLKQKLQIMQNKIVRYILDLDNRAHIGCNELEKVNMLYVEDRVKQMKLNHVFKIWNGYGPEYMREKFSKLSDTESRTCTRASSNNFFLPRVRGQGINTFYFTAIKDWNSLPVSIKEIQNFENFKTRVKTNIACESKNTETCPFLFF